MKWLLLTMTGALVSSLAAGPIGDLHADSGSVVRWGGGVAKGRSLSARVVGRLAFERAEEDAVLELALEGIALEDKAGLVVEAVQFDACGMEVRRTVQSRSAFSRQETSGLSIPVETRLKPGRSELRVKVSAASTDGRIDETWTFELRIGPRFADRMPSVMWGMGNTTRDLADFGFTHGVSYSLGSRGPTDDPMRQIRLLDSALADGVRLVRTMGPTYPDGAEPSCYQRWTRKGLKNPHGRADAAPVHEVSHPVMLEHMRKRCAACAAFQVPHPAFTGVLPCSEMRDRSFPSFNTESGRYQRETGLQVPDEAVGRVADLKSSVRRYPDGIVPDDDPVLAYYRWFWGGGDGWPAYTGVAAQEFRRFAGRFGDGSLQQKKRPFFSFFDPAVRCPPVWGSGGDVDVISQWDYAVPEPLNVAGPTEELFAMAEGHSGQQVMAMTQLICYRAQIAPSNVVVSPAPEWVSRRPRAGFPSIPPDILQEATWAMLAKPVKGVMFHGWGTIFETGSATGYCLTNPETAVMMRRLLKETVAPLGPFLMRLGRESSPVAVLESATTCLMGGYASWGWKAPAVTFLQRARLDPRVVYEQKVMRDGFADTKVLYVPQCRFLTPSLIGAIRKFQSDGGLLIGDEELVSALKPDIAVPLMSFEAPPASDHAEDVEAAERTRGNGGSARRETIRAKAFMVEQSDKLRHALEKRGYLPRVDSSSAEIVVFNRHWRGTPYVFAVNDRRTFGDYVGPWGMVMEQGLPCCGEVSISCPAGGVDAVYELAKGGELPFRRLPNGKVAVSLEFATNDGRLLAFLPKRISSVALDVPKAVTCGDALSGEFRVLGSDGRPVEAVLPVEIRVFDGGGRELDGAGWSCAEGGLCRFRVPLNLNDAEGAYSVVCRDRASGLMARAEVAQTRPGQRACLRRSGQSVDRMPDVW